MKLKKLLPNKLRKLIHENFGVNQNSKIVQLFLNDGKIKTEFSITNAASFFDPENAYESSKYNIELYDCNGSLLESKIISLPKFGSKAIKPEIEFKCAIPKIGMFVAQSLSPNNFSNKNKNLGLLNCHFYAFYQSVIDKSIALIHPQHFLTPHRYNKIKPYYWVSQYVINTKNITRVEVYQLSVLENWELESGTELIDAKSNQIIDENSYFMKVRNIKKTVYDIKKIRDKSAYVKIGVKSLCGDNAKPLLFIYSDDGNFTATHA